MVVTTLYDKHSLWICLQICTRRVMNCIGEEEWAATTFWFSHVRFGLHLARQKIFHRVFLFLKHMNLFPTHTPLT